jgi:hypothetical protein
MRVRLVLVSLSLLVIACGEVKTGESVSSGNAGSENAAQAVGDSKKNGGRTTKQGTSDAIAVGTIGNGDAGAVASEDEAVSADEPSVNPECALGGSCQAKKPAAKATPVSSKCALGGC